MSVEHPALSYSSESYSSYDVYEYDSDDSDDSSRSDSSARASRTSSRRSRASSRSSAQSRPKLPPPPAAQVHVSAVPPSGTVHVPVPLHIVLSHDDVYVDVHIEPACFFGHGSGDVFPISELKVVLSLPPPPPMPLAQHSVTIDPQGSLSKQLRRVLSLA